MRPQNNKNFLEMLTNMSYHELRRERREIVKEIERFHMSMNELYSLINESEKNTKTYWKIRQKLSGYIQILDEYESELASIDAEIIGRAGEDVGQGEFI